MREFWKTRLMLLTTPEGMIVSLIGFIIGTLIVKGL
jgi:F0F1-type ATP synthase assembly protein I